MGLTHHWRRGTELPAPAFASAVEDCSLLLGKMNIPLAGPSGNGQPVFQPDVIAFNGAVPAICEPFEIHQVEFDRHGRPEVRSFCKTESLPYDLCVRAALIILKQYLGEKLEVKSDAKTGWNEATRIVAEQLGYGLDFDLSD